MPKPKRSVYSHSVVKVGQLQTLTMWVTIFVLALATTVALALLGPLADSWLQAATEEVRRRIQWTVLAVFWTLFLTMVIAVGADCHQNLCLGAGTHRQRQSLAGPVVAAARGWRDVDGIGGDCGGVDHGEAYHFGGDPFDNSVDRELVRIGRS